MSALLTAPTAETAPRYTSYPTAPHFHPGVTATTVRGWMGSVHPGETISLYLHVPFCDRLCWFCACHTTHTLRYEPVADYLAVLHREISLVAQALPRDVKVGALHFGGGSPTMLKPQDLCELMGALGMAFSIRPDAEISVEIDPNDMDAARLDAVAAIGTTRASLGVQDFDPRVQKAINREQSFETTRAVVEGLRARGVAAINLDLVYGLPHQTIDSVASTVLLSLSLSPDRLALFGYAHVPWFKKHQTMIDEATLPGREARLAQASCAAGIICEAGYEAIGIDHFARRGDGLAVAQRLGRLQRNFQGYTDDVCETLVGLGPSAVSRFREGHAQNAPAMGSYRRAIDAGELATARGIALSDEDRVRGWVIERLMCEFGFSVSQLAMAGGRAGAIVAAEAEDIARRRDSGLVRVGDRYEVTEGARARVRSVAARFDPYLALGTARHSAAV
jgi:oxygen-independent coproporphyrinogen-3 oxidase